MTRQADGIIRGERIFLRPLRRDDTPLIVKWRNADAVRAHFVFRRELTKEAHGEWFDKRVRTGEVVQFVICVYDKDALSEAKSRGDAARERAVGSVYLRDVDREEKTAEYGIFIGEADARGRGVGTETARLFTAFGIDVLHLHRISLKVLGGNEIARRSYEKAGFAVEGLFRDFVKLDGVFTDVVFMAKFAGEGE